MVVLNFDDILKNSFVVEIFGFKKNEEFLSDDGEDVLTLDEDADEDFDVAVMDDIDVEEGVEEDSIEEEEGVDDMFI